MRGDEIGAGRKVGLDIAMKRKDRVSVVQVPVDLPRSKPRRAQSIVDREPDASRLLIEPDHVDVD